MASFSGSQVPVQNVTRGGMSRATRGASPRSGRKRPCGPRRGAWTLRHVDLARLQPCEPVLDALEGDQVEPCTSKLLFDLLRIQQGIGMHDFLRRARPQRSGSLFVHRVENERSTRSEHGMDLAIQPDSIGPLEVANP